MKCPDPALGHVFEPVTQVIVEVPCLLDLLVIALPVLFEKLVEGKEMMGIKTSGVKEPNRKSPRDTPVTVSEGVNRDEAVMAASALSISCLSVVLAPISSPRAMATTSGSVRGFPSMAVEEWANLAAVSR